MSVSSVGVAMMALLCLIGTTTGCRRQSGMEALLGDRARMPAPMGTGSCDFALEGVAGETAFFVLGMLNEYRGRSVVEDEDVVEGFYCDEISVATVFREALLKLAKEQDLDPSIRTETTQGCLVTYRSKQIADRLNSCYRYQASSESVVQGSDGTYRRIASPSLEIGLFLRGGQHVATGAGLSEQVFYRDRALAYVAGAWARYGRNSTFVFANAQHKARLVAQLLTYLGCQDVRLESNFGFIPQTNVVRFEPTVEVRDRLQTFGEVDGLPNTGLQPAAAGDDP